METEKSMRLLYLYQQLISGDGIRKKEAAERFGVDERSIQRDIESLREFFEMQSPFSKIKYNSKKRQHELISVADTLWSDDEVLAVCKILLESRSLMRDEMDQILDKMLACCAADKQRNLLRQVIANEWLHYLEPHHGKPLLKLLWTLQNAIIERCVITVEYCTQKEELKQRRLHPVGLMFSEFYFYLTAFIDGINKSEHFEYAEDPFPTIYRVDRIQSIHVLEERFSSPYSQRFEEGEFRKRVQFMYGGRLQTVWFKYLGPSVESVLDRIPTAQILSHDEEGFTIRAEVFGKGIDMWLKSQGDMIRLITKPSATGDVADNLS